jgi:hypothetical protein
MRGMFFHFSISFLFFCFSTQYQGTITSPHQFNVKPCLCVSDGGTCYPIPSNAPKGSLHVSTIKAVNDVSHLRFSSLGHRWHPMILTGTRPTANHRQGMTAPPCYKSIIFL